MSDALATRRLCVSLDPAIRQWIRSTSAKLAMRERAVVEHVLARARDRGDDALIAELGADRKRP